MMLNSTITPPVPASLTPMWSISIYGNINEPPIPMYSPVEADIRRLASLLNGIFITPTPPPTPAPTSRSGAPVKSLFTFQNTGPLSCRVILGDDDQLEVPDIHLRITPEGCTISLHEDGHDPLFHIYLQRDPTAPHCMTFHHLSLDDTNIDSLAMYYDRKARRFIRTEPESD